MRVIFIKDLKGKGKINEIKEVSDGYATNFLIKNGYAVKYTKESSKRLDTDIKNNEIRESNLKDNQTMLFIPSDINDKEKTNMYSSILFESFKLSGILFEEFIVLDDISKTKEYVDKASLIFLSGGDTYIQNKLFSKTNLKECLQSYNGLIIGQSAGTINMATKAYNSPEEMEQLEPSLFKGLGLVNINVEPHFIYNEDEFNEAELYQREDIIYNSYERKIYGQCDGSHIVIDDNNIKVYGETYLIHNGSIKLICKDKEVIKINE